MMFEPELFTHCQKCGRKLKNPKAMKIGFGVVCLKKIHAGCKIEQQGVQLGIDEFVSKGEGK